MIYIQDTLPEKASKEAACYDVKISKVEHISDNNTICYLGFSATPPKGYKIVLVPRSSITKTNWIMQNSPGQGDAKQ